MIARSNEDTLTMAFVIRPVSNLLPFSEEIDGSGMLISDILLDVGRPSSTVAYRLDLRPEHNRTTHMLPSGGDPVRGTAATNGTDMPWYSDDFLTATAWTVVKMALLLALAVSAVCGSIVVIMAEVNRPKQTTKPSSENAYQHVVSLCLVSVLTGILPLVYMVLDVSDTYWQIQYVCLGYHGYLTFVQTVSQAGLLLALMDCSAALAYPIRYPLVAVHRRITAAIIVVWLYAIGLATLPVIWFSRSGRHLAATCNREQAFTHAYNVFMFVHFVLISVADVIIYVSVCFEIWQKRALVAVSRLRHSQRQRYEENHQRAAQHAVAVVLASFLYLLFWGPYMALFLLHAMGTRTELTTFVEEVLLILGLFHCSVTPAVFFFSLKPLQYGYRRLRCCVLDHGSEERSTVRLNSVSFRSRVTGSLLSLHTALDGKAIRLPHLVATDVNCRGQSVRRQMAKYQIQDGGWCTASSASSGVYSIGQGVPRSESNNSRHTRRRYEAMTSDDECVRIPSPDYC